MAFVLANVRGTIAGGGILLWLGYRLGDQRPHLSDRADWLALIASAQIATRNAVLRISLAELEFAAARIPGYIAALEKDAVPYPGFDANGRLLVGQTDALISLRPESIDALVLVYNRLRSINTVSTISLI